MKPVLIIVGLLLLYMLFADGVYTIWYGGNGYSLWYAQSETREECEAIITNPLIKMKMEPQPECTCEEGVLYRAFSLGRPEFPKVKWVIQSPSVQHFCEYPNRELDHGS